MGDPLIIALLAFAVGMFIVAMAGGMRKVKVKEAEIAARGVVPFKVDEYVAVGLTTTEPSADNARREILTVAATRVADGHIKEQFARGGAKKPDAGDVAEFLEFVGASIIVAFDAAADVLFMGELKFILTGKTLKNDFVDLLTIEKAFYPQNENLSLADIANKSGVRVDDLNSGSARADATFRVYEKMKKTYAGNKWHDYEKGTHGATWNITHEARVARRDAMFGGGTDEGDDVTWDGDLERDGADRSRRGGLLDAIMDAPHPHDKWRDEIDYNKNKWNDYAYNRKKWRDVDRWNDNEW